MTDNKYTDIMRAMERHHEYQAASHSEPGAREAYLANASDWRAMREAWEAMVEACGNAVLCWGSMDYDESPFRRETIAELRAALAKARGE